VYDLAVYQLDISCQFVTDLKTKKPQSLADAAITHTIVYIVVMGV